MPIRPDAEYQEHLKQGQFKLQRSRASGGYLFYPRVLEPATGNTDLEWTDASGLGTIYSVTIIRPKPPAEPYNVALVELDEGPRMMTRIDGIPVDQIRIGTRVKVLITSNEDQHFVVFEPIDNKVQKTP
ncbi:MAG TPA: OB-fold domain-containing protein [Pseudomonas xinjiangensis]|uniref:OB-fold domain-containing protein n=2 Tax=root TaxID=1 RepID=A0A7V1BL51_9GAMM|nr:OB-fold domain-containing protein [Halopseudomonas xinjiangensis]HEC47583.1 OB-fold domain-containing protein [Halopseudomonas xinjiangensis]